MESRRVPTVAQPPPIGPAVPAMAHLQTPPASGSRHQRLLSGARIIKSYVHESELRREASRFNNAPASLYGKPHLIAERSEYEEEDEQQQQCHGKQNALRLPAKPSTAPETQSYRLRQHAECSSSSNNNQREEQDDHRDCITRTGAAPTPSSSLTAQQQQQQPLAAFFAGQTVHRARRLSISAAHAAQVHANAAAINGTSNGNTGATVLLSSNAGGVGNPVKPVAAAKRKLQMESVTSFPYRTTTNAILTMPGRGRNNNLSAKLDAVVKSSLWMRRKVMMSDETAKPGGRGGKAHSPRHGSTVTTTTNNNNNNNNSSNGGSVALPPPSSSSSATNSNNNNGAGSNNRELPQHELEKKVMAAFSRIVRMWRERKRRSEAKTLTMMNGNKLRKDNGIQSAHVVGILSRRMIREVPALKFFDVEPESTSLPVGSGSAASKALVANGADHHSSAASASAAATLNRNTPRGVCYTLDANGCRCIKMESGALQNSCTSQRDRHKKKEEVTIEKAMSKTLRRKMAKRVKTKRLGIRKLADDFHKTGQDHARKLHSQLALHQAEGEKMFSKRLAVLMSDDTSLPSYQAQKELYLARVRCWKADLMEKCQTLYALGALLQHVETEGELSGLDVSSGELHFLDLFRCVVEEDKVLTPLIADGIRQQLTAQDQQNPTVTELMAILRRQVNT